MIHDSGPGLNEIKGQAENVWKTILEILKRVREAVQSPNALVDQFQIIFRDESEI